MSRKPKTNLKHYPKPTVAVSIRVPEDLHDALSAEADRLGLPKSRAIVGILSKAVKPKKPVAPSGVFE